MTEDEARAWVEQADVPRGTSGLLERFAALILDESGRQNLIARSTIDSLWSRHFVDSLQLLRWSSPGAWLDIGSGAGFPGLVIALASRRPVTLVEPRALRAAFLTSAARELGMIERVRVVPTRVETARLIPEFATLSARAFASLAETLTAGFRLARPDSVWLLPRGRSAEADLAQARRSWHGSFRLVPSITDPDAAIVVATDVRPRMA